MAGFFPGKPAIYWLMNGGFFGRKPHQSSNYEWQGVLHENRTFVSPTPTMLLKLLYKIRPVWTGCWPVHDRGLLLVQSLPVAVRPFGQCEYIRTGLCLQEQKTGPDRTFKHYPRRSKEEPSSLCQNHFFNVTRKGCPFLIMLSPFLQCGKVGVTSLCHVETVSTWQGGGNLSFSHWSCFDMARWG